MAKQIKITQIRSTIDAVPKHKLTIQAIGFVTRTTCLSKMTRRRCAAC
jgi:ribosomal protein L30/L7E